MDDASIHKSETTKKLIEAAGCKLVFLHSYSPDLNTIEHFWTELKKQLRYIMPQFETFQEAMSTIFLQKDDYNKPISNYWLTTASAIQRGQPIK